MAPNPLYQLLKKVFSKGGHSMPTGKPLYAYRCNDEEYQELETLLINMGQFMSLGKKAPMYVHEAFCLYAAEWVRRNHTTGHVRWRDITDSLEWGNLTNSTLTYLTEKGLSFWQRPLRVKGNNPAYLLTLVLEGGLPLKMMVNNKGTLVEYFKKVLTGVRQNTNAQLTAVDIAEQLEDSLPNSLRNEVVFALAGEFCETLNSFAKKAGAFRSDIVDKIKLISPLWYRQLPVVLSEQDAEELAKAVFSVEENSTTFRATLKVQRDWIKDDEECWHCEAKFKLPLSLKHGSLVKSFNMSEAISATRLLLRGVSNQISTDLALLSKNDDETWSVEKYPDASKIITGSAALSEISMDLFDGNNLVGSYVPTGGVALPEDLPWVLDPLDEDANELRMIGSGSLSTTSDRVYIAMPLKNCFLTLDLDGDLGIPEIINECERYLLPIKGDYVVTLEDGQHCTVRTGQEQEEAPHYLFGRTSFKNIECKYPIFCGEPIIYQVHGADYSRLDISDLYWRKLKGGVSTWLKCSEHAPLGKVELRQMIKGEVKHSTRCVILPSHAHMLLTPLSENSGLIKFSGLGEVQIQDLDSGEYADLTVEQSDDFLLLTAISTQEYHQPLRLKLVWHGYEAVEVSLPFPAKGCRFVGNSSSSINSYVGVNELYGLRAEGIHTEGEEGKFWLELEQKNSKLQSPESKNNLLKIKYLMQQQDETTKAFSLNAIQAPLKGLLSSLPQDSEITLRAYSAGCKENKLFVSTYSEPIFQLNEYVMLKNTRSSCHDDIEFSALNLIDLDKEPVSLILDERGVDTTDLMQQEGIWLVYGERGGPIVTNQLVVKASTDCIGQLSLVHRAFIDTDAAQVLIDELESSYSSQTWFDLLDLMLRLAPFNSQSFPILEKLASKEPLLLALLFNAMFKGMQEQVWQLESQLGFCWGGIPLEHWENSFKSFAEDSQRKMCMPAPMLLMIETPIRSLAIRDWRCRTGFNVILSLLTSMSGKQLTPIEMASDQQAQKAIQDLIRLVDGLSRLEGFPKALYFGALQSDAILQNAVKEYWRQNSYAKDVESPFNHVLVWAALTMLEPDEAAKYKLLQPLLNLAYQQAPEHFGPLFNYFQNNLVK
ncbi:STY4851/ECs_5259 family protein [Photobacterium rosenbergii]|uniref:STY4851/ECs_5259 family protein n=1 Tax=Photobacterium rosenbergii TaxID=294936 RepID=UPI001C992AD1|nr:STY4851/ECs_5259 family protein [Photobacterium rosenbergii]MBY5947897.1 STY4851/ECs_5259 family protein [Photobacterium rosenbergii]